MRRFVTTFIANYIVSFCLVPIYGICISILMMILIALNHGEVDSLGSFLEKLKFFSFIDSGFGSGNFGMRELLSLFSFFALCLSLVMSILKYVAELVLKRSFALSAKQQFFMYALPITVLHIIGGVCMTLARFNFKNESEQMSASMIILVLFVGFWIISLVWVAISLGIRSITMKLNGTI